MGDPISGREIIAAFQKGATWGTEAEAGANDGILLTSESIIKTVENLKDESAGLAFVGETDEGKPAVTGSLNAFARYEGLDVLIASVMGTAGAPTIISVGHTGYTNTYALADGIEGIFGSFAIKNKSNIVFAVPSMKVHGFTLSGEMNAPCNMVFNCIGNNQTDSSTVNTTSTMGNVTYPTKKNRVIFDQNGYFRINDKSSGALSSSDGVAISSFEFAFDRPVEGDYVAGSQYITEPSATGHPVCTLTINFPRYNDAAKAFWDDWDSWTEKKGELYLQGPAISGTDYHYWKFQMPHLRVVNPSASMSGAGKIPASLSFDVLYTASAPTGITATNPFQLLIQNTRSTDPLA